MKAAGHLKTMLVSLWIAAPLCVADDASALGYLQLSFGSEQAGYGNGHVQYDPASLTPYYDYRDAWMACEASGDFGPCDELPRWINFGLSITEAELRISGAVFETSDFSWSFYVTGECFIEDCGRDYSSINIDNGPDFIWQECDSRYGSITEAGLFKDCGEFEYLDGRINGVYVDWYRGDYLHWSEAPIPAPEPGTLALLGLGLAGLGLIQRRRT